MIAGIRDQLARDEGRSRTPYQDSLGWWSVGVGHCLGTKDKSEVPVAMWAGLGDAQVDALFDEDLRHANALLSLHLPWAATLPEPHLGVLQNMAFNLGTRLLQFGTFLSLMRARSYDAAAQDLLETAAARELPARYGRLAQQLLTGEWQ